MYIKYKMGKFGNYKIYNIKNLLLLIVFYSTQLIAQKQNRTMQDTIKYFNPGLNAKSFDLTPQFLPLRINVSAKFEEIAPLSHEYSGGTIQQFSDPSLNSRIAFNSVKTNYVISWKSELIDGYQPSFILQEGNRILIEAGTWQLFNMEGRLLNKGRRGTSHLLMNKKNALFFYINANGELSGRTFSDGSEICASSILFGDVYFRRFMTIHDSSIFLIENERQLDPHMHYVAGSSIISKYGLEDIFKFQNPDDIKNVRDAGYLNINSTAVIGASFRDSLVFTYQDRLLIVDSNLKIVSAFSDNFAPLSISTDEAGRIYLLNDNENGRCLWVITKEGEKLFSVEVPEALVHPPIVGYDHRVFIPCEKNIAIIEQDGKHLSSYIIKHKFNGAIVTADDNLLVSDGSEVVAFDNKGESTVLFKSDTSEFCTPPVITESGNILVASKEYLYCLESR